MSFLKHSKLHLALAALLFCGGQAATADAAVIEKVVAIIGERAIFLSELRLRAKPLLLQVYQTTPPGAPRSAAISQVHKMLVEKMVDEELEERAAAQSKVSVTTRELDEAIQRVAAQNKMTQADLVKEAERAGLSEKQYREELRHQLLQSKLTNLRLQGRVRVSEAEIRAAYRKLEFEDRQKLPFSGVRIVLHADPSGTRNVRELAEKIAERAKRENFDALVAQYSEDEKLSDTHGKLSRVQPVTMDSALARVVVGLEIGEVSPAVRVGNDYVIIKVLERDRSELPNFEEARRELSERVYMDKMGQARRTWLEGLRRQYHVEVRL